MNHRSVYLLLGIIFSIISAQPTFTEHVISTAADGAQSVDAADLDGDGDIDVVSASGVDDKIAWYENDGAQNFTEHVISDTASMVNTIYVADVDGDGDMDVLYSKLYDGIGWYENDGSGNFTRYSVGGGSMSRTVYAADVDGDGNMDVLNESNGALYWHENDGSQNFEAIFVSDISSNSGILRSIYAVDVDGDGDMDLLSASDVLIPGSDDLSWYENDGSESFTKHTITSSSDGNRSVYATDVDGDGDMDVLTACFYADKIAWYENDGSEGFTEHVITASADRAGSVYAADVDGDGDMDVLSASENHHNIAWYENNGSENFTEQVISTSAPFARSVYATDVDGDGDMDVLSASSNDDKIAWYEQDGSPVIETTYIPDDNFEQALIDLGYDDVLDDYVLTENISGVAFLNVNYMEIIDLTGIEDFTALVYLYCRDNQLTSLDISNNIALVYLDLFANGLTSLDISNNIALVYLNLYENGLTSLDISNNTVLKDLDLFANGLTELDISSNTALEYLMCNDNQLTSLDVSNNTVLNDLRVSHNQLTSLDVSNNTILTSLEISGNELTDLDISNNPELMYLGVSSNNLTSIDLSANTALVHVTLYNTGLTDLDVSNNTALDYLECGYNQLTSLDVSNHTALTTLRCSWNQITSLDLSNNTALTHLGIYSNLLTSLDMRNGVTDSLIYFEAMSNSLSCILVNEEDVAWATENWSYENQNIDEGVIFDPECLDLGNTYIPDDNFEQALIDLGHDDVLDDSVATANIYSLGYLNIWNREISDLTGIEDFTSLGVLDVGENQLTSLDLSNNPLLVELWCNSNQLTSLDLSNNTNLIELFCSDNQLTSIDVSNNTSLDILYLSGNQLTTLDLSNNLALSDLYSYNNQLTSLDVSNNTALDELDLGTNQLTSLDVSNNTALRWLYCNQNQLTSLDLVNNTALTVLSVSFNQLTSLDLSNNTALLNLNCSFTDLSSLNLKGRHPSEYAQIDAIDNWALECVDVLDPGWASDNWGDFFDRNVEFEFICGAGARSQWHVAVDGSNNSGDGSIENPLGSIQLAINISSYGDSIMAGPGTYYENINWINKNISIIGSGSAETIIDAQQLGFGIKIENVNYSSLFQGFSVKNSSANEELDDFGHGILMHSADLTLNNIVVEDCYAHGIFVDGSSSLFNDIIVKNNEGAGIYLHAAHSYPVFKHVKIDNNSIGMVVYDTGVVMDSSEISNNIEGIGYVGVGFHPSHFTNSLFYNNGSENSNHGAINLLMRGALASFENCIFYGNKSATYGSDINSESYYFDEYFYGNDIEITNSVFYSEQSNSIYLHPTETADTLHISYSNLLNQESIYSDNGNYVEFGDGMIYGDPMFCGWDYSINAFSPLVGSSPDGSNIANLEIGCGFEPTIISITDVPNDQGGRVYLEFNRSPFDNEGDVNQLYTIFRMDVIGSDSVWVIAASGAAIGDGHYTYEVLTIHDSTSNNNGLTDFKVVASVDEGVFHSEVSSGYSVDNIVPMVPTGMLAVSVDNYIFLEWNMSPDGDFQYYELVRSGGMGTELVIELVETSYEDYNIDFGVVYSYKIAAYDYNGNFSGYSEPVLVSMLIVEDNGLVPNEYTLHQNYPNPFNPTTKINYELPNNGFVKITIYDVMGHEVKSLVNMEQEAGYRLTHWNATNDLGKPVPAGMYIYTIQAGNFRETKKMVLLK